MRARTLLLVGGATLGLVAGWWLGQQQLAAHRNALFSAHPVRRFSALGYLAGQDGVETVQALRDYLSWEQQPMLRRRAEGILRRLEATLA